MKQKENNAATVKQRAAGHVHGPNCNHDHDLVCELRIRQYKPEDFKSLTAVWKNGDIALDDTDTEKALAESIKRNKNGFRIFVAEAQMVDKKTNEVASEPMIAGGAIVTFDGHRAYVYHLAVHSEFRTVGLGRAILESCEQQAQLWGARHLRLTSRTDASRSPARKMYKDMGWVVDDAICTFKKTLPRKK